VTAPTFSSLKSDSFLAQNQGVVRLLAARVGRNWFYLHPVLRFHCQVCGTITEHRQIAPPMREGFPRTQ